MSLLAVVLIVVSACMHVGWNLFSKYKGSTSSFFLVASLGGAVLLSPILFLTYPTLLNSIGMKTWFILVVSNSFQALYYMSLAKAYTSGDISVIYPVMRSFPVIIVIAITFMLNREDTLSLIGLMGMLMVVGGCFILPMRHFTDFRFSNYLNSAYGWAFLAAIGTTGYSVLDDEALKILRENVVINSSTEVTILYSFLSAIVTAGWIFIFKLFQKRSFDQVWRSFDFKKNHAILTGMTITVCYLLVLLSLEFVKDVSYVVGFRQLSIPLGTVLSILFFREPAYFPKIIGVTIVFAGLLLIALY